MKRSYILLIINCLFFPLFLLNAAKIGPEIPPAADGKTANRQVQENQARMHLGSIVPEHCHWVKTTSVIRDAIVTEDGSTWQIDPFYPLPDWDADDYVVFAPNEPYCSFATSKYSFRVTNLKDQSEIYVNFKNTSEFPNEHALYVVGLDVARRLVTLSDGSVWSIGKRYNYVLRNWELHENVFIGVYESCWYKEEDRILINLDRKDHVAAKMH